MVLREDFADGVDSWTAALANLTNAKVNALEVAMTGLSAVGHKHSASDIDSGTLAIDRIPLGSSAATVCVGNDVRLSNTRTPTDNTVSTVKLQDGSVTAAKLQSDAVTTPKILDAAVTGPKIAAATIPVTAFDSSVGPAMQSLIYETGPTVESWSSGTSFTPTIASSRHRVYFNGITGAMTFNSPGGSPANGSQLVFLVKDNGTARALTFNSIYLGIGNLPTTTTAGKWLVIPCEYVAAASKWFVMPSSLEK